MRIQIFDVRRGDTLTSEAGKRYTVAKVRRRDDAPDVIILQSRVGPGGFFEIWTDVARRLNMVAERSGE